MSVVLSTGTNRRHRPVVPSMAKRIVVLALVGATSVVACGDTPLGSIGDRSSGWINEPTVPSTKPRVIEAPQPVAASELGWANDDILNTKFETIEEFLAEVFGRREGDRFIQASRTEIAFALPGVAFPGESPPGAEWVSSQLVFDNDGSLAEEPTAAFGIWSAEPYTRSRSVAQMIVMRVSMDPDGPNDVAEDKAGSCARFADQATQSCQFNDADDLDTWTLKSTAGTTVIWFESGFRYELFGRSFVAESDLQAMRGNMIGLNSIDLGSG